MQQLKNSNQSDGTLATLHSATEVGTVTLKVADLNRSLVFYTQLIGLQAFKQDERSAVLGAGKRPILNLEEVSGAKSQPPGTTGLYHAAILWPDRRSLAIKIAQISSIHYPFGFSDHLVSEAFYLSDPDGNGLELYRDRPRAEWKWTGSQVQMANAPIDFDNFFAEIPEGNDALSNPSAPDGTKLGHMHLRVGDIPTAEKFYHDVLGFDVVATMPSALFVSAGGYHHHIGMNTWESRNGKPPIEPSAGLHEFSISLPDKAELDRLTRQIEAAGVSVERGENDEIVLDPWQNRIKLLLSDQLVSS
jgi:catechol 2,3-dioxygenase